VKNRDDVGVFEAGDEFDFTLESLFGRG